MSVSYSLGTRLLRRSTNRPPGPRPRYPGQFVVSLATDKLALFGGMARHGDVSQIMIGPQRVALLSHPDDIQALLVTKQRSFIKGRALDATRVLLGNGLLTSEGEEHLRQRRLIQPAFHKDRLTSYGECMAGYAERLQAGWQANQRIDIHEAMMRVTLAIAGRTLFDADVEGDAHDVAEALELSLRMFNRAILPMGVLLEYAPIPWVRELHRSRRRLDALIRRLIEERRAEARDRGDLLSMLITARDEEGDKRGMTDKQLRDELVTLILAAHETTANALTWTWYLLSRHPHAEARLHQELDEVLGGRLPTVADLPRLPYTRQVIAESMRIFPPAWAVERRATEDVQIGGYTIRKGTVVLACQYFVHRDPRWWPEPERFLPERWSEPSRDRPKFAYFPFGAGTRICIGEHFAWMEATLVLATLAQRWRMRYEERESPIPEPMVTLRPRDGLPVRLVPRTPGDAGTLPAA
ncbi:MAG TPA: cytochrome P450 [Gemmatimonadaceae bacterium]|nr:cytochrome P450 [Gemmatimonadaceae bacterium]